MNPSRLFRNFVFLFSLLGLGSFAWAKSYTLSLATSRQGLQTSGSEFSNEILAEGNESIVIEVVNYSFENQSYIGKISLEVDTGNGWVPLIKNSNVLPNNKITLLGPCKMRLNGRNHSDSSYYYNLMMDILYTVEPKEKEAPSKKFATVIPENSENNVSIILEQSTDLINWTTSAPGVFPPSTAKRFFRVRSEEE
jgi:hypothetical protein